MSVAAHIPLKFQVGARTLFSLDRRLARVPLSLDEALADRRPTLPPLTGADGYLVTSLPETQERAVAAVGQGLIVVPRQRYTRYYVDLSVGEGWWTGLSSATRSTLKRKAKKAGALTVHRYRTPDEMAVFHSVARGIAAKTYQERLLGAALPDTPAFITTMTALAAADDMRAWTLDVDGVPAAYLYCPARGRDLIYEYVGHDPAFGALSVGTLLQVEALRDLLAEGRFARFDFTEGEGQHKRTLSTGGVACVDLLLLRPTLANRAAVAALRAFDGGVALAKRVVARAGLESLAKRVRRG
ncbi:GNAT family N-acetyltransferase [uncultured Sphingomonas sp.]|uniref:GNAT family N-acetyltransferase n=1 Tax=uncultured Sphingomonas sp. TaxID=158754 RepID=UPI0025FF057B|nr:GNAT family N-acetyltransferase [uncultured Sphingomonas sp.]